MRCSSMDGLVSSLVDLVERIDKSGCLVYNNSLILLFSLKKAPTHDHPTLPAGTASLLPLLCSCSRVLLLPLLFFFCSCSCLCSAALCSNFRPFNTERWIQPHRHPPPPQHQPCTHRKSSDIRGTAKHSTRSPLQCRRPPS